MNPLWRAVNRPNPLYQWLVKEGKEMTSLDHIVVNLYEYVLKLEREKAQLRAFAFSLLKEWPEAGIDGLALQDTAIAHGLLRMRLPKPTAPCSPEGCSCAEYFSQGEWAEGVECYQLTPLCTGEGGG